MTEIKKNSINKTKGLIAAAFTPLDKYGNLNLNVILKYYEYLRRNNVIGVFINGTSGEAFSLTTEERKKIVESWIDARKSHNEKKKDFKLIVHVGATGINDELSLASHLKDKNVEGFSSMAPIFFKPDSIFHLIKHIQKVAGAAPNIPYYYYHVPQISGYDQPMIKLLDLIQKEPYQIPNFSGIKFSLPNFNDYMECQVKYGDKYDIPFCADQVLICALPLGATSSIGSTYNYSAPLSNKVMELFWQGKIREARYIESELNRLASYIRSKGTYFAIAKGLMRRRGLDLGAVRSPLLDLENINEIVDEVEAYIIRNKIEELICK